MNDIPKTGSEFNDASRSHATVSDQNLKECSHLGLVTALAQLQSEMLRRQADEIAELSRILGIRTRHFHRKNDEFHEAFESIGVPVAGVRTTLKPKKARRFEVRA